MRRWVLNRESEQQPQPCVCSQLFRYTRTLVVTRVEFRLKHIESSYRGVTLQPNPNVYGTNTPTEVSSEATAFWGSIWHRWGCNDPTARHSVIGGSKYRYIGPAGQRSPGC
eukprot:scaffold10562_cov63-Phaeocystis_antarctica.AAC.4